MNFYLQLTMLREASRHHIYYVKGLHVENEDFSDGLTFLDSLSTRNRADRLLFQSFLPK
jgi:hypothetical protein